MTSGLIGAGIIGIVISAFSITMSSFQQSSRALAQKMEISQLQSNIKGRQAEGDLCKCNIRPPSLPFSGGVQVGDMTPFTFSISALKNRTTGTFRRLRRQYSIERNHKRG